MYRTVAARTITSVSGTWPRSPRTPSADDVVSAGAPARTRSASNSASESSKRAPEINNQLSFEGRKAWLMSSVVTSEVTFSIIEVASIKC